MGLPELSRRSLLRAGAGALLGASLRPAESLAAAVAPRPSSPGTIELGELGAGPRTVALPPGVGVVGLQWYGPGAGGAALRLRVRVAGGWGPWVSAAAAGHAPEGSRREAQGEPLWVGGARELELQSAAPLHRARLRYVLSAPAPGDGALSARAATGLQLAQPVLDAGPGQPPVIARSVWARGTQLPRVAPAYGAVELGFVHHTDNPNGYAAAEVPAMLRAIYAFHRDVNGWNDIGYNFVIDLFGRIFEARAGGIDQPVVGAHAGGYNIYSTGIAVLGTFSETPVSAAAKRSLERLLAWKLSLHGTPTEGRVLVRVDPAGAVYSRFPANARVSLPRIAGHRDADSTDCPGDVLYGELAAVRRAATTLAGSPAVATLELLPAPAAAATPSNPAVPSTPSTPSTPATPTSPEAAPDTTPQLRATLRMLGTGAPLAGAPVVLQSRLVSRRGEVVAEATLAEGVTDAEGRWTAPASFAVGATRTVHVRVVHTGSPAACVSPSLAIAPLPALSPAPATAPSS